MKTLIPDTVTEQGHVLAEAIDISAQSNALANAVEIARLARQNVDSLAIKVVQEIMQAHGWHEIVVDVEECSLIERAYRADGTEVDLSEFDEDDLVGTSMWTVGQCPRNIFTYRDGDYRVTVDELAA